MSEILLDTCAVIWVALGQPMTPGATENIETQRLCISAVTALEIAILVRRNRLLISAPTALWFEALHHRLDARLIGLAPGLLIASAELAADAPNDPFDRIVIATAQAEGLTVMTRDRLILDFCRKTDIPWMVC